MASRRRINQVHPGRQVAPPEPVRFAVVGLGHIAQESVLPAFENARHSARLTAFVSDSERKMRQLAKEYGVRHTYSYDDFAECLANEEVDAVYIAVPNQEHARFAVAAAEAGVHVLCEKPMALTERDCQRMIRAADDTGVKLMIAYRLHFEPATLAAVDLVQSGRVGEPRYFSSTFSYQVRPGNIRTKSEDGGGPLWDIGIYCINAARMLFGEEPHEVLALNAKGDDPRFRDIEETSGCILRFPGGRVASFVISYGSAPSSDFHVFGTRGEVWLENAYDYHGKHALHLTVNEKPQEVQLFPETDQFGPELAYFAACVRNDVRPEPSGLEGLADVRIIEALHKAARTGRSVKLPPLHKRLRPTRAQEITMPAVHPRSMVDVQPPAE